MILLYFLCQRDDFPNVAIQNGAFYNAKQSGSIFGVCGWSTKKWPFKFTEQNMQAMLFVLK